MRRDPVLPVTLRRTSGERIPQMSEFFSRLWVDRRDPLRTAGCHFLYNLSPAPYIWRLNGGWRLKWRLNVSLLNISHPNAHSIF
jgi:hypothetical protein